MNIISLRFFILLMICALSNGIEMVKLKGKDSGQSKTSSTLLWKRSKAGRPIPRHAIPVNANNPQYVWCRGTFNSIKVPGGVVDNGTCAFAFYSPSVVYATSYDVLVSDHGAARIKSIAWDSLMAKPKTCLLSPHRVLISISDSKNSSFYVAGNLGPMDFDRKALYPSEDSIESSESGYILVEDEPVAYTLTNIKFQTKYQVIHTAPYELNSTQLINLGLSNRLVDGIVSYTMPIVQYWGNPKGTISGLQGTIYEKEEKPVDVIWGLKSTSKRIVFTSINYELPPLSAVNVTVVGNMESYEAPYNGILTTIYDDGFSPNRPISSFHTGKVLKTVVILFSSPFYLNGSIVDEPERSELVYEHTTTTTTTTTTTQSTTASTTPLTTETSTLTENSPVLITGIFSSPPSVSEAPQYDFSSEINDIKTHNYYQPEVHLSSFGKHEMRNTKSQLDQNEKDIVDNDELKSTSDRIISVLSTIFTGLIFWYFSFGMAV